MEVAQDAVAGLVLGGVEQLPGQGQGGVPGSMVWVSSGVVITTDPSVPSSITRLVAEQPRATSRL